jgi:hypothetical protein
MAEMILPGVYIEVRPEALIVPGTVTVGTIGIVGTARQGPVGEVKVLGSYTEARETFGAYDAYLAPEVANNPLTLVRALQLAYDNGASSVLAVRVSAGSIAKAKHDVDTANGVAATLTAKSAGTWGNDITVAVEDAADNKSLATLECGATEEEYTVADGNELVAAITASSTLVDADPGAQAGQKLMAVTKTPFAGGDNGADAAPTDYATGLELLMNEDAHIMLAAGQDNEGIGSELTSHVQNASKDKIKHERIAVVGCKAGATLTDIRDHTLNSDRVVFAAPGVKVTDAASREEVELPGAYAAAAIAGMLSERSAHISLTNKTVSVKGLATKFTAAQLEQLVPNRVLALEVRRGFRVVKAITTSTNTAWHQITTRRIVDYAKYGVRSAAEPYIGLLNNDRVRKALSGSINGFLAGMVDDEMLISYELDVTATRDEEIRGIAKVTMTLRPTFSIDYIKVVMFLG